MMIDHNLHPVSIRVGNHTEPLILSFGSQNTQQLISNVCTHRGNILLENPSSSEVIRCSYHGRCFDSNGQFKRMPEFRDAVNFPSLKDDLARFNVASLGPMIFGQLSKDGPSWQQIVHSLTKRLSWLDFDQLLHAKEMSRTYLLEANWALYVENYLEGFHIPFVHQKLNQAISYEEYETHLFDTGSLQIATANASEASFMIPKNAADHGKNIYAYYFWFFPNLMINVYPWGISLNQVLPLDTELTEIQFKTFLWPGYSAKEFKQTALHITELEDEAIVRNVQLGIKSLAYDKGRFSPSREVGVHHFQRLVCKNWREN